MREAGAGLPVHGGDLCAITKATAREEPSRNVQSFGAAAQRPRKTYLFSL